MRALVNPQPLARHPVLSKSTFVNRIKTTKYNQLLRRQSVVPAHTSSSPASRHLVHASSQRHSIKSNILPAALNEPLRAQCQRLVTQYILAILQRPALERALAPAIQLPQLAIVALYKTDVVQVNIIGGLWRGRVALAGGRVVRLRQALRGLKELGAPDGVERDRLFEELVEGRVGL